MANILLILSSSHHNRVFHVLGLLSLFLLIQKGGAFEFWVGGSNWSVPTDPNAPSYNKWAETNRFQIGDTLLFVYPPDKDSVLHVTKEDYINCNCNTSFIEKFSDGHTVFKFKQSGSYYFISGIKEHCLKNEKLVVIVLADRSNQSSNTNQTTTPPPSGSPEIAPSLAPTPAGNMSTPPTGIPSPSPSPSLAPTPAGNMSTPPTGIPSPSPSPSGPSPAPSSKHTPPPSGASPPAGSAEIIPSSSPSPSPSPSSEEKPPPSGASSIILTSVSSIGAFVGLSILSVF